MRAPTVVCDIDDTLYLERDYVCSGFRAVDDHVRSLYAEEGFFESAWALFLNGSRGRIFDEVCDRLGLPTGDATIAEFVAVYRSHAPTISLLPDALAALGEWEAAGCRIAIITDGPVASQRAKVDALGMADRADPIVVTEERGPAWRKPSPHAFAAVQRHHGGPSESYVYVADNPSKDFGGPKALGWQTYRVRRAEGLHVSLDSGPDVDAEGPVVSGLLAWLGSG